MPNISPIIFSTVEDANFQDVLKDRIKNIGPDSKYLLEFPTVYIHYWKSKIQRYQGSDGIEHTKSMYNIYVGESNNVVERTKQHYQDSEDPDKWQYHLTHDGKVPNMFIIGFKHFNKSFTLDVENKLMEYFMAMNSIDTIHNGRTNPQNRYYPVEEFETVFHKIWTTLRLKENTLFMSETEIRDSAIFKASPLKKLTDDQITAKNTIINRVLNALEVHDNVNTQLIFVQGSAGTGKTVLTTSAFYDLVKRDNLNCDCHLLVNHDEQLTVYEQMANRVGLPEKTVTKPTTFINNYQNSGKKADVVFIDEGHLLWTQSNQAYQCNDGSNQLQDILDCAKVVVFMFDEYQILTTEQIWEQQLLDYYRDYSRNQGNFIELAYQLRMKCAESTTKWIDDLVLNKQLTPFAQDDLGYEVKAFDSPDKLFAAIKKKSEKEETKLSRLVASYDWEYNNAQRPEGAEYWGVTIGEHWFMPWNYEIKRSFTIKQKRGIKRSAWAEQPHTINEIGSTFTIQGFDLSYVGVILGPSIIYKEGRIEYVPEENKYEKVTRKRTISDGTKQDFSEILIRNQFKVLMTRGVKGLYIYACNDELRNALKEIAGI